MNPPEATGDGSIIEALSEGSLEILGLLPRASNYTFLTRIRHGDAELRAVYKPRAGETPLWDFPEGTLCLREVAAYRVSQALSWPDVPPTVLREGPEGVGSVQLFVRFEPREHFFTLRNRRADDFRRIALFDAVVNNADRKSGHCLLAADGGAIHVVDHGVCFHTEPKLRTVIWDYAGDPIPDDLCREVGRFAASLTADRLGGTLDELLAQEEIRAMAERAAALVAAGRFPFPGPGYPYPWPPI